MAVVERSEAVGGIRKVKRVVEEGKKCVVGSEINSSSFYEVESKLWKR